MSAIATFTRKIWQKSYRFAISGLFIPFFYIVEYARHLSLPNIWRVRWDHQVLTTVSTNINTQHSQAHDEVSLISHQIECRWIYSLFARERALRLAVRVVKTPAAEVRFVASAEFPIRGVFGRTAYILPWRVAIVFDCLLGQWQCLRFESSSDSRWELCILRRNRIHEQTPKNKNKLGPSHVLNLLKAFQ